MGRPIKKIHIGERGAGNAGGEGLASVTLGGTNNSTGATLGDALTIGVPDLVGGVQAVGTVAIYADGALLEGVTTFGIGGLGVDGGGGAAVEYTGVTGTGGSGTGAIFTITKANTNLVTDYSDLTIEITTIGSGFTLADDIVILGSAIGGVDTTNDLTLTVTTFVTAGTVMSTTITTAGDGYTSAPTVSQSVGTQGTLSMTGVLTATNAAVIAASAFVTGGSSNIADITAQKGTKTYRVTTTDGTEDCKLVAKVLVAGEMEIIATDSLGNTYWVTKLFNNTAVLKQKVDLGSNGYEFADGVRVKWADTAVLNDSVKITY